MKKILLFISTFAFVLVIIPIVFSVMYKSVLGIELPLNSSFTKTEQITNSEQVKDVVVPVMRVEKNVVEELPIEEYIMGVVSGEMYATYEVEALKAQAVAARTYAISVLSTDEQITDTVQHQVYLDDDQLKERWGQNYDLYKAKIQQAVLETAGQVIEYNGDLIMPLYFSVSNGKTENASDYWSKDLPYFKSVSSEWDKTAPNYEQVVELPLSTVRDKFNDQTLTQDDFKVLSRTEGNSVEEIQVGEKTYTGREVRELLALRSADFSILIKDNIVVITTRGYGHGVGMSQYGANELAKQGKTYVDILNYYYQDIKITEKNS
ncbi:MAG TPA: stage II sporulation protein D [Firmicutes bacterium]|nr:stage II sporulation protein D [Bacillota bacterium]